MYELDSRDWEAAAALAAELVEAPPGEQGRTLARVLAAHYKLGRKRGALDVAESVGMAGECLGGGR